jgi:hypothetical protein
VGIAESEAEFLRAARSELHVDFSRTLTLGRQELRAEGRSGWADPFFVALDATEVRSLDASSYEGATDIHDLNDPIPRELEEQFTAVVDAGTTEHVFNLPEALRSAMRMVAPQGHLIVMTPCNESAGHGFYQLSPELYWRALSAENGFEVRRFRLREHRGKWFDVADPAAVGRRSEFGSSRSTYLFVVARRVAVVPIFNSWPQQSDYETEWTGRTHSTSQSLKARALARAGALRRLAMKVRARSWPPSYKRRHEHFTEVRSSPTRSDGG